MKKTKITKNFSLEEFECKDGTQIPEKYLDNVIELAHNLQVLRYKVGKPVRVNSAYRPPAYNKSIGGSPKSQHLVAKAADIKVDGMSTHELHFIIEELIASGEMKQGGLGLYNGWIHYDIRGTKARWSK